MEALRRASLFKRLPTKTQEIPIVSSRANEVELVCKKIYRKLPSVILFCRFPTSLESAMQKKHHQSFFASKSPAKTRRHQTVGVPAVVPGPTKSRCFKPVKIRCRNQIDDESQSTKNAGNPSVLHVMRAPKNSHI